MTPRIGGRLLGLGAAAFLLAASAMAPVAAIAGSSGTASPATSAARLNPAGAVRLAPWTSAGRPLARRYGTGRPEAVQTLVPHSSGPGAGGLAGQPTTSRAFQPPRSIQPDSAPPPVAATLTSATDHHLAGFAGLAAADQHPAGTEPADSTVAAGPEQVVQMTSSAVRITDRTGTSILNVPVASLFQLPAAFFDRQPRVVYDSLHGRFVATETSWDCFSEPPGSVFPANFGHGYIDLAVSETSDPSGTWDLYFWGYSDQIPGDPSIGTSTDKLAVSDDLAAMTHGDGGAGDGSCAAGTTSFGGDLLIANWADVVAHNASTLLSSEFLAADPFLAFGLRAALQTPATDPTLYVIARSAEAATNNDVIVSTFTGTTSKTVGVTSADSWDLTSGGQLAGFADPGPPHQPGSPATLAGVSGSPQGAVWQTGQLSWATTYPCTPSGDSSSRDCVRVSQLATAGAFTQPVVAQDFLLARNGFDSYLPGIAQGGDGTLDIAYTQSNTGAGNYPSSYEQYQRASDSANTASPAFLLAAGTGSDSGGTWSSYAGLSQDPQVAASVWQANASSSGSGWTTFVDRLGQTAGTTYVPITSVRIVDTRNNGINGLSGLAGKFSANSARPFQVAGLGAIPAGAVAVSGNLTVTGQNGPGYVSLTPNPTNTPGSSTLNFPQGDVRANNVAIPLNSSGQLAAVFRASSGKTTDLVFDVTGYFLPGSSHAHYVTVVPVRAIDSRSGTGQPGNTPARFLATVPQTFQINGAGGVPGIPADAVAVTGNLTVTDQTQHGYLSITTAPTSTPSTSTLNFPLGDTRANGFTAQLDSNGQLSIVYMAGAGTTDVVLDITGYFTALSGLSYYPLNPGRVMDTRPGVANTGLTGAFGANTARTLEVAGHWGIPTGAQAITGNLTVTGQTASGYVSMTPDPTSSPTTSTLNFPLGDTRANGLFGPLNGSGDGSLVYKARAGRTVQLILDVSGYFK
jgi:hypothetical protein